MIVTFFPLANQRDFGYNISERADFILMTKGFAYVVYAG